jgi:hypothetical protein
MIRNMNLSTKKQAMRKPSLGLHKRTKSGHAVLLLSWGLLLLLVLGQVQSIPTLPTEFYGTVKYYNIPASTGVVIRAYEGGQLCGRFTISQRGYYGVLSCKGDWLETNTTDEGASEGSTITFTFDNSPTSTDGDATFTHGALSK